MALLEARKLTVSYGGLYANDDIDLDCESGKLIGLIGPNGAGKTTFIDAITGFTPLTGGVVTFDGVDLADKRPDSRASMGLVRTFQSLELFEDLTVRDNLLVAAEQPKWFSFLADIETEAVATRRAGRRARHPGEPEARSPPAQFPRPRREPVPDRPRHGTGAQRV